MINHMGAGMIYVGPLVYFKIENDIVFGGADFDGGRFYSTSYNGYPDIRFLVTDHLGSVRRVLDADLNVVERNDYYPFGKRIDDPECVTTDNIYRYNGKESLEIFGFPYSDYGARLFDSNIGRWLQTDPLASDYPNISPYTFCANNPIVNIDLNGKSHDWVYNEQTGDYEWMDNVNSPETTPDGYSYVGAGDEDILDNMGVSSVSTQNLNRKYVGINTEAERRNLNSKVGAIIYAFLPSVKGLVKGADGNATICIKPIISYKSKNISKNNTLGRTFDGISIKGSLNQADDAVAASAGQLSVVTSTREYHTPLKLDTTPSIKAANTFILSATINIFGQSMPILKSANISAGTTNNEILKISPINVNFGLMHYPVLY